MAILDVGDGKTYSTITAAVAAARTGSEYDYDIIEIYDNKTYNETIATGSLEWVKFRAAEGNYPIIDRAGGGNQAFYKQNYGGRWIVEGLTLLNFNAGGTGAVFEGAFPNGSAISIRDCVVVNANRFFWNVDGTQVRGAQGSPTIVERNFLSGTEAFIGLEDDIVFRNNIVMGIETAWNGVSMADPGGISQVVNNLIIVDTSASFGVIGYTSDNGQQMLEYNNNIVIYNGVGAGDTAIDVNWPYARNNLVVGDWDNLTGDGLTHSGSLTASLDDLDDIFVDFDTFISTDIQSRETLLDTLPLIELVTGSMAIKAGSSGSNFTNTSDILGRSRLVDYDRYAGYTSSSVYFDGHGDKGTFPFEEFDDYDEFSVSIWIQPKYIQNSSVGHVWSVGQDGGVETSLMCRNDIFSNTSVEYVAFEHAFSGDNGYWTTPMNSVLARSAGDWYHVVITYDRTSALLDPTCYIDGTLTSMSESQGPSGTSSALTYLTSTFGVNSAGIHYYEGFIRDFSFWSKQLDADEVAELFGSGAPKPLDEEIHSANDSLVLYVPFDEVDENGIVSEEVLGRNVQLANGPYLTGSAPSPNVDIGPMRFLWDAPPAAAVLPDGRDRICTSKFFRNRIQSIRVYPTSRRRVG